ncbi:MAG: 50S ribosomal protein L25, partial [bacterium]|nr:50S ribosomal protein L25 [bacterium]
METYSIVAEKREETGKSAVRKLRVRGLIPANLYGTGEKNRNFTIQQKDVIRLFAKEYENIIIELSLEGETIPSIIKEIRKDVLTGKVLHIDFQHVQMGKPIKVQIPVHLKGVAPGVKVGGIVEHFLRDIGIECLPKNIPSEISVDISALNHGDAIHVSDLPISEEIRILDSLQTVIVSVVLPAKAGKTETEVA